MPYELNSRQLFLTYPQCTIPKEVAYQYLSTYLSKYDPEIILVAHELHATGDSHLHAYVKCRLAVRTKCPSFLDLAPLPYAPAHGNYQGCRSAKNVIKYCTKADDFIANVDVSGILESKTNYSALGKRVMEGENLINIVQENPHLIFRYNSLKNSITNFFRDSEMLRDPIPLFLPNPWGRILWGNRKAKKRHYWIYSRAPNKGKTTLFAEPLSREFRFYLKGSDFSYWNITGTEEGIIIDEYNTAKLKWDVLNQLADGTYEFRVFQGGLIRLKKPLIIILSNQSLSDLYPYMNNLLYERYNEIEIV